MSWCDQKETALCDQEWHNAGDLWSAPIRLILSWPRLATHPATPGTFTIPAPGSATPKFYRIKSE